MRFIVYGAGGVGGVIGARLFGARLLGAGHEVVLIARGAHLEAMRRGGLRLLSPDGERRLHPTVLGEPGEVDWKPGDVVLLAMKSMDTEAAVRALAAHADPSTPVVCVQNSVANERAALRRFANVYGVCVMLPAEHLSPGVVVGYSSPVPGILDLGRYPSGSDDMAARIAEVLHGAGFEAEPRADIMRWKYRKLLANLGNAIEAVCGRVDGLDEAAQRVQAEGEAVLRAAGIEYVSEMQDAERRGDILRIGRVAGQVRRGGSSWQSLARQTGTIEADYLNGEIVLLGRLHGVPTPLNEYARRLANRHARERIPPGSLTPAQFLEGGDPY